MQGISGAPLSNDLTGHYIYPSPLFSLIITNQLPSTVIFEMVIVSLKRNRGNDHWLCEGIIFKKSCAALF